MSEERRFKRGGKPGRSYLPLAIMILYLVAVRLTIARNPDMFRSAAQAAVFTWPMLAIVAAVGLGGTWIARRTDRFPEMWDRRVSMVWRLWTPALLGLVLGGVAILVDRATHWTTLAAQQMKLPSIHIDAPASFLIYPGGAIIVSILCALIEPCTQDLNMHGGLLMTVAVFADDYLLNIGQVFLFRRAGFVAAVLLRVAFYVVWHMIWPAMS